MTARTTPFTCIRSGSSRTPAQVPFSMSLSRSRAARCANRWWWYAQLRRHPRLQYRGTLADIRTEPLGWSPNRHTTSTRRSGRGRRFRAKRSPTFTFDRPIPWIRGTSRLPPRRARRTRISRQWVRTATSRGTTTSCRRATGRRARPLPATTPTSTSTGRGQGRSAIPTLRRPLALAPRAAPARWRMCARKWSRSGRTTTRTGTESSHPRPNSIAPRTKPTRRSRSRASWRGTPWKIWSTDLRKCRHPNASAPFR